MTLEQHEALLKMLPKGETLYLNSRYAPVTKVEDHGDYMIVLRGGIKTPIRYRRLWHSSIDDANKVTEKLKQ